MIILPVGIIHIRRRARDQPTRLGALRVGSETESAQDRVRLIQVKDGKMPISVACLLRKRWLGENSMSVIEHTEQPLGKFVFALVIGTAYVLAAVALVYPFYMYLS
jgi:hypothetical protein